LFARHAEFTVTVNHFEVEWLYPPKTSDFWIFYEFAKWGSFIKTAAAVPVSTGKGRGEGGGKADFWQKNGYFIYINILWIVKPLESAYLLNCPSDPVDHPVSKWAKPARNPSN